jgi:hypothetical protein
MRHWVVKLLKLSSSETLTSVRTCSFLLSVTLVCLQQSNTCSAYLLLCVYVHTVLLLHADICVMYWHGCCCSWHMCASQMVALLVFRFRQNTVSVFVVVVRFVNTNRKGVQVQCARRHSETASHCKNAHAVTTEFIHSLILCTKWIQVGGGGGGVLCPVPLFIGVFY